MSEPPHHTSEQVTGSGEQVFLAQMRWTSSCNVVDGCAAGESAEQAGGV